MGAFALIGGRNKDSDSNYIEAKLIELSHKSSPNILFCAFATINELDKYNNKFKALIQNLNCNIHYMTVEDINKFDELLSWCDIFYCNGGASDDLVELFRSSSMDIVLKKHINEDKIFAGISAGAMLYTIAGMGDKYAYLDNFKMHNYKMVKCLGILPITICPHYQNSELICYNDEVRYYNNPSFGIEDDTMLFIKDDIRVYKADKRNSVYYFDNQNDYLMIALYEGIGYEKNSSFRS